MTTKHTTHANLIADMLRDTEGKSFQGNTWGKRHCKAWTLSGIHAVERPIVSMIRALADYADNHFARYETALGDDYVLGAAWATSVRAVRSLLDGEIGALDAGTVDGLLCAMLVNEGLDPEGV